MAKATLLLLTIGLFVLVSCSDRTSINLVDPEPVPTPTYLFDWNPGVGEIPTPADRWFAMKSTVHFSIDEGYSWYPYGTVSDPMLIIHQVTDDEYSAYNFSIIVDVETAPGLIRITYESVYIGNFTQDALGPAHTWSHFGVPEGVYTLELVSGDVVDKYELIAERESFKVRPIETHFTRNENEVVGRYIPRSFGLYWFGEEGGESYFNEIAELLLESGNIVELEPTDQLLNPLWDARPIGGENPPRLFSVLSDTDFSVVRAILHRAVLDRYQMLPEFRIAAVDWRNERFDSRNYQ